jgi:hypothetical protein
MGSGLQPSVAPQEELPIGQRFEDELLGRAVNKSESEDDTRKLLSHYCRAVRKILQHREACQQLTLSSCVVAVLLYRFESR